MSFFTPLSVLTGLIPNLAPPELKIKTVNQQEVDRFSANPKNPYLVSFPRTGSHWIRMLSELVFEQPTLVRPFHYRDNNNYLYLHHHDIDLSLKRTNVVYLYREPVATVYSDLKYHRSDPDSLENIRQKTTLYACHAEKWLCQESFTTRKTVLNYEAFQKDVIHEFTKLANHLELPFDADRLVVVAEQITKNKVKEMTNHYDDKVVNQAADYDEQRELFKHRYGDYIWDLMLKGRPHLRDFFSR